MKKITALILALLLACVFAVPAWPSGLTSNKFLYKPDLGAKGLTEKNTFDAGLDRVDARLGKEIWVGDPNYGTTLQEALTTIDTSSVTLRVPAGTHNISENFTIPATIALRVERGAILAVAATKTLTINGPIDAGLYQIFSCIGSGKVVFGVGSVKEIYPQWWGAVSGTECGTALNACLQAGKSSTTTGNILSGYFGFAVKFPAGLYLTNTTIKVPPNVNLTGDGPANSVIKANTAAADPVVQFESSSGQAHSIISQLAVNGDNKVAVGISFTDGAQVQHNYATVSNCYLTKAITGIKVDGLATAFHFVIYSRIVDNQFEEVTNGILLDNRINALWIERNFINATDYGIISNATAALDDVQIVGNTFDGPIQWAIKISGIAGTQAISAIIARNRLECAKGVYIVTPYTTALMHDNQFSCTGYAVQVKGYQCSIQGNQFSAAGSAATYAINIESGAKWTQVGWNNYGEPGIGTVYPKRILDNGFGSIIDRRCGANYASGGTYEQGEIYQSAAPASGGSPGAICTTAGTYPSYSSTGAINTASTTLTVASASGLSLGEYITIAGVTGVKKVMLVSGTTVTIDVAADATVGPTSAVAHSAPVFSASPNLAGANVAPAVPASTVEVRNWAVWTPVRVTIVGGTVTAIAKGFTSGSLVTTGATGGAFILEHGEYIAITYSMAPTWTWFGM